MITIKLRKKNMSDGRLSLYLDIYENGDRRYEFLKLYLYPEVNNTIKAKNKETLRRADVIRSERMIEAENSPFGFAKKKDVLLLPLFAEFHQGRNSNAYPTIYSHLCQYCKPNDKVSHINDQWVKGYIKFLRSRGVSDNSIAEYIALFRVFWRWCEKKLLVSGDPFATISLNTKNPMREYLTIDELQKLAQTPTKFNVRRPFLFSCFTGLRWSDVCKLRWGDVEIIRGRTRIVFRQQKTGELEYMDLNEQAVQLMGTRRGDDVNIFYLTNPCTANDQLKKWVASAGIKKHITFHCARHTFATMLLTLDTDIYVVSKLLGHTDISTTQIYAKIVDKKKQQAVDNIPQLL